MKKLILFSFVLFGLLSCNKDGDFDSTEYYVKYEVSCQLKSSLIKYSAKKSTIVINGTGTQRTEVRDKGNYSWSDICGPFKKGEEVYLSVVTTTPSATYYDIDAKMAVCKDSSPFATKKSSSAKNSVLLSYKIE